MINNHNVKLIVKFFKYHYLFVFRDDYYLKLKKISATNEWKFNILLYMRSKHKQIYNVFRMFIFKITIRIQVHIFNKIRVGVNDFLDMKMFTKQLIFMFFEYLR